MSSNYASVPGPADPADAMRWQETRRRRRMLEGTWGQDLESRLLVHFGQVRRVILGPKSKAKNPAKRLCEELAVLHVEDPKTHHGVAGKLPELLGPEGFVVQAGLWPLMRRVQVFTLGLREELLHVDWDDYNGGLTYTMVHPDTVVSRSRRSRPGEPFEVRELLWQPEVECWVWHVKSVEDLDNPRYQVVKAENGADVTREARAGETGWPTRWRWTQGPRAGRPFLPYVTYHADVASQLWDPYAWMEVFDGALDVAAAWTWWHHVLFKASWPQRWGMDVYVEGTVPEDTAAGSRSEVPADPTSLVHLASRANATNPQVGQWAPSADVLNMQQAISAWERSVHDVAGVDAANIVRDSSDAWSGAALSISRDGKREAQQVFGPKFRPSDLAVLERSAAICNHEAGTELPEQGYRIEYTAIPLSPQELKGRREHNTELIKEKRMGLVEAYQDEHPGVTDKEAESALIALRVEEQRITQRAVEAAAAAGLKTGSDEEMSGVMGELAKGIIADYNAGKFSAEQARAMLVRLCGQSQDAANELIPDEPPESAQPDQVAPKPANDADEKPVPSDTPEEEPTP